MKQIKILIGKTGIPIIESFGYNGPSCLCATREYEKSLVGEIGGTTKELKMAEFSQIEGMSSVQIETEDQ